MRIIWRALINAVAIAVAAFFVPGISWGHASYGFGADADKYISLLLTGLVLGIVNAFIRPIIELISAPITCLTLGLFHFVIGALMLYLISLIPALGFQVADPIAAFLGAIVIAVVGVVLSWVLPD
jgi:putative membrane protein